MNQCNHGQLARTCNVCELEAEVARLRGELRSRCACEFDDGVLRMKCKLHAMQFAGTHEELARLRGEVEEAHRLYAGREQALVKARDAQAQLATDLRAENERLRGEAEDLQNALRYKWQEGQPPKWFDEWFIARTSFGDRCVLKRLPEEYTYDYTTADGTYFVADKMIAWMQFPDSNYKPLLGDEADLRAELEAATAENTRLRAALLPATDLFKRQFEMDLMERLLDDSEKSKTSGAIKWARIGQWLVDLQDRAEAAERDAARKDAALLLVNDLISQSGGVYGLHLNGDGAPWDDLLRGG